MKNILITAVISLSPIAAYANPPVMHFSHENRQTIANDELRVVLNYDKTVFKYTPSVLESATQEIQKNLQNVKHKHIEQRLLSFNVLPVYDYKANTVTKWQINAQVELKSKDFVAINQALGKVSGEFKPSLTEFRLSKELKDKEMALLKKQTLKEFLDKAKQSASYLGYKSVNLKEVTVSDGQNGSSPPVMYRSEMKVMASSADVSLPVDSAGSSEISFSVQGSVFLINP